MMPTLYIISIGLIFVIIFLYLDKRNKGIEQYMLKKLPVSNVDRNNELSEISKTYGVKYTYGKLYAYNPRTNEIMLAKKELYSEYDRFCFFHEVAHFLDNTNNKILYWKLITGINKLLIFPLYIIVSGMRFANNASDKLIKYSVILLVTAIIFEVFNIICIFIYEPSASKKTLHYMVKDKKIERLHLNKFSAFGKMCLAMQVINVLLVLIIMIALFVCLY